MDKFGYIGMSLFMLPLWILIFAKMKDFRFRMIKHGIYGAVIAMITEPLFIKDYWSPPPLFGIEGFYLFEDFCYGFLLVGISITIYDFIFGTRSVRSDKKRRVYSYVLVAIILGLFAFFGMVLGYNTTLVISYNMIIAGIVMILLRQDLLVPAVLSGVLVVIVSTAIYMVLFNLLLPNWWSSYWKLANEPYAYYIFGIPWTEYLWYFALGFFISIIHDFSHGNTRVKQR